MSLIFVAGITLCLFTNATAQQPSIPNWVKNNAKWWSQGQVSDAEFVKGIQYLVQNGIIQVPQTQTTSSGGTQQIPQWIRNTAGWWADGQVSDNEFIKAIQWLVNSRLIQISPITTQSTTASAYPHLNIQYIQVVNGEMMGSTTLQPGYDVKVLNETSAVAAIDDYQAYSLYYEQVTRSLPFQYAPTNTQAQCNIFTQISPDRNNNNVDITYLSLVCVDQTYVFIQYDNSAPGQWFAPNEATNSNIITRAESSINNVVHNLPTS